MNLPVNLQGFGLDCLYLDPGIPVELIHSQGTFILSLDGSMLRGLDLADSLEGTSSP